MLHANEHMNAWLFYTSKTPNITLPYHCFGTVASAENKQRYQSHYWFDCLFSKFRKNLLILRVSSCAEASEFILMNSILILRSSKLLRH